MKAESKEFRDLIRHLSTEAGLGDDVTVHIKVDMETDRNGLPRYRGVILEVVALGAVVGTSHLMVGRLDRGPNLRVMRRLFRAVAKELKKVR